MIDTNAISHTREQQSPQLRIAFLGDLSANDASYARIVAGRTDQLFKAVRGLLAEQDLVVANLEAAWDRGGESPPIGPEGKIHIRTGPRIVEALRQLNVSTVSFANNHSFDFGPQAWTTFKKIIAATGVQQLGAGRNTQEAAQPLIHEQDGITIGLLAYADRECGAVYASTEKPGVNPFDVEQAVTEIKALKSRVDHVVLLIHWGEERILLPSPKQRDWARRLSAAGADILIGHHAHVLQGYENIDGMHAFYSLGNFMMADIYEGQVRRVRYCRDNYLTAVPIFSFRKGARPKLEQVRPFRSNGTSIRPVSIRGFTKTWKRLCGPLALGCQRYEMRFRRHQDFMWRYYIPIRYQVLLEPRKALQTFHFTKLLRWLGFGHNPWRETSMGRDAS
jgi:poly-gamma-glutamate capsule biosynthesis protein CapA/YwtB (metallophosphatase superfamily)